MKRMIEYFYFAGFPDLLQIRVRFYKVAVMSALFLSVLAFNCSREDLLRGADSFEPEEIFYVQIVSADPPSDSVNIPVNTAFNVTFDDNINMDTVNLATFSVSDGSAVNGIFTYEPQLKKIKFKPFANLQFGKTYTVNLSKKITNVAGETLFSDYTWTCETAPADVPKVDVKSPLGIMVNGESYDFGGAVSPDIKIAEFKIINNGTAPLEILSASVTGDHSDNFLSDLVGVIIPVCCEHSFNLTFAPDCVFGQKNAILSIQSNDFSNEIFTIDLKGTSLAVMEPKIQISMSGSVLENGTSIIDFGTVKKNQTNTIFIYIHNIGMSDLLVDNSIIDGNNPELFSSDLPIPSLIIPGTKKVVSVIFSPVALGTKRALLHIHSNDSDESPFELELKGRGVN